MSQSVSPRSSPHIPQPLPFLVSQWEDALQSFKSKLASGEDVFGPLIRKYLLENKHRVTLTMLPDSTLAAQVEEQEKARLVAARGGMDDSMVRIRLIDQQALAQLTQINTKNTKLL